MYISSTLRRCLGTLSYQFIYLAIQEAELEGQLNQNDIEKLEAGQPWVLKAEVVLKPEVKLGTTRALEVEAQDRQVSDQDVKDELESRRLGLAELSLLKRGAAELADTVVIDFEGFLGDLKHLKAVRVKTTH